MINLDFKSFTLTICCKIVPVITIRCYSVQVYGQIIRFPVRVRIDVRSPVINRVYTGFYSVLFPRAPYGGVGMDQPFFLISKQSGDGNANPGVQGT